MTKRKAFFVIVLMILLSSVLLIVGNNIPVLASYRWFWAPITLFFAVLFYPKVFLLKNVYIILLYGFLFAGILQFTLWSNALDAYKESILDDFYNMLTVGVILTIFLRYSYYSEWIRLSKIGLWFFIITGFMTLVATEISPSVVRASYSSARFEMHDFGELFRLGFGSYGYMTALVALFPVLVYLIKNNNDSFISKRNGIILLLFFYLVLVRAQIFANILVATGTIILSIMGSEKIKKNFILITLFILFFVLTPVSFWSNTFYVLSGNFQEGGVMHQKLIDFAVFLEDEEAVGAERMTGVESRAARYPELLDAFLDKPFWGDASYKSNHEFAMRGGKHLYWMSMLALWGIFGFLVYVYILRNVFRPVFNIFDSQFKFYYILSLLSIISLGLLKNLIFRETYIVLFIIIPGLYLSQKQIMLKIIHKKENGK